VAQLHDDDDDDDDKDDKSQNYNNAEVGIRTSHTLKHRLHKVINSLRMLQSKISSRELFRHVMNTKSH